jgi:nucleoside-diphosphate-sugar epimerase
VRQLLDKGYYVRVLDKLFFGEESIQPLRGHPHFELVRADMLDIQTMSQAIFGCKHVIHLAAIVGDPACALDGTSTIANNYFTVKTLADISKHYHVERFIFASSCSVYGAKDDDFLDEGSELNPVSLYAETRVESEKAILELADDSFSPVVFRLGTVYGVSPRMRFDLVVNLLTALAVRKKEISVFGGSFWRPFVHCEDVASAFSLSVQVPREKMHGCVFNVGSTEENYQISKVAELITQVVPGVKIIDKGDGQDMRNYRVSFKRIKEVLGYKTQHTLQGGIEEIASIMLENGRYDDYLESRYSNFKTQGEHIFAL